MDMMSKIKQAKSVIEKRPKTFFDDIDVSLDGALNGNALRERLAELSSLWGTISTKLSWYQFLQKRADLRKKKARQMAIKQLLRSKEKLSISHIDRVADGVDVKIGKDQTNYLNELENETVYGYYVDTGMYKLKELENNINIGRSMLSWDKSEIERNV